MVTSGMAFIPSLSLWSSIKIPFGVYGEQKTVTSVPHVVSCKHFKQSNPRMEAEPAREMVSLLVPTPFGEQNEKISPRLLRGFAANPKKRTHCRCPNKSRMKRVGYVTVPEEAPPDRQNDWGEDLFTANSNEEPVWNSEGSDLRDVKLSLDGKPGAFNGIPSVKPWTPEELDKINGKYPSSEKVVITEKNKKNKSRGSVVNLHKLRRSLVFSIQNQPHCECDF